MAVSEVVKSGYLTKSPPEGAPVMSQWRKRWFVLCDSKLAYPLAPRQIRLEYYQSASDSKKLADPKGSFVMLAVYCKYSINKYLCDNYLYN